MLVPRFHTIGRWTIEQSNRTWLFLFSEFLARDGGDLDVFEFVLADGPDCVPVLFVKAL
jgi:hypothetical protein